MKPNEEIVRFCIRREDFADMSTPDVLMALDEAFPKASIEDFKAGLREAARRQAAHADELEREGRLKAQRQQAETKIDPFEEAILESGGTVLRLDDLKGK